MPKNKTIYFAINILFIICALFFVNFQIFSSNNLNLSSIIIVLLLFFIIHISRFIRMYFILLEDLIHPSRFLQLYLKTTFVSSLIPFKIGELFKMYCYGVETNKPLTGIIAVFIEKFFDAIILCVFMIPYAIEHQSLNTLLVILLVFIILALVVYFSFEGTYRYLNKFLIRHSGGRKSLTLLKILEGCKKAQDGIKHTLQGRFILLLLFSLIAWGAEGLLVATLNTNIINFDVGTVINYISDGFFGISNILFNYYSGLCAITFIPLLLIIYGKKYFTFFYKQERSKYGKSHRNL